MNDELSKIWNYCEKEQIRINNEDPSEYQQGMIIAYRKVQWEINNKCSSLMRDTKNFI